MDKEKYYKNTRTGVVAQQFKIMQSSWDIESDKEKIKEFFSYAIPGMRDIENGDILIEICKEEYEKGI